MKTYTVCLGAYIRAYSNFDIEADSVEQARDKAIALLSEQETDYKGRPDFEDLDWSNIALPTIENIHDAAGGLLLEGYDFALNSTDRLQMAASELFAALDTAVSMEYDRDDESRNFDNDRLQAWQELINRVRGI